MIRRINSIFFLFISSIILIYGCEKFDDGGRVAQSKKNIVNKWALQKVYKNNVDRTSELVVRNFTEEYTTGSVIIRSYTTKVRDTLNPVYLEQDTVMNDIGNWNIDLFTPTITFTSMDSIFNFMNDTIRTKKATILKLTKDEYWYSFLWIWGTDSVNYQLNFEVIDY